ncbi:MAG: DUF1116 domain-containing protein [Mycobacterium sp.]
MTTDTEMHIAMLTAESDTRRREANALAVERMLTADPYLVDVAPARDVVPGMTDATILTSGAPLRWEEYTGGQRRSVLNAAVYEGLADSVQGAETAIAAGQITVRSTQQHQCVGSVAGIYTASMPVLVVEERTFGGKSFCNLYEGQSRYKLNYGAYDEEVRAGLQWLEATMGPVLADALKLTGPIPLKPMMARALRLGDELHSRNTAGTLLFERELTPAFTQLMGTSKADAVAQVAAFFRDNDYTFLRMSMAAAKAMADAAHGVAASSLVTGMVVNCQSFAIRVSGMGDQWFTGAHPQLDGRFFDDFGPDDAEWIGGESCFTEVVGLGGFAQAAAPALQAYQGGSYEQMRDNNCAMYEIAVAEHPDFRIPALDFRGSPVGIDVVEVLKWRRTPMIDGGLAGRGGGQIGAGLLIPDLEAFQNAFDAYRAAHDCASDSAASPNAMSGEEGRR